MVICEASFGKKELAFKVGSHDHAKEHINVLLKDVEARRDEHSRCSREISKVIIPLTAFLVDSLDPKLNQLNVLLSVLRPKTTKKGHSAKRQKTSR